MTCIQEPVDCIIKEGPPKSVGNVSLSSVKFFVSDVVMYCNEYV